MTQGAKPDRLERQERLLIVDDERDLADALALHLQGSGRYRVETVYSGEAALERLELDPPDKVLLDVALPGLSGWEVCRRIRSLPATRRIPVVLMTAWLQGQMAARAADLGVTQVLIKPFEDSELDKALELSAPEDAPASRGREDAP